MSVAIGASVALAARGTLAYEPLLRSPSLWALVALLGATVLPVGGYVLHGFADWSLLYVVEGAALGEPAVLAVLFPVAGVASFVVTRRLLLRQRAAAAMAVAGASLVVAVALVWLARDPLSSVGSAGAYHGGGKLRPLGHTTLAWLLAGGGAAVVASWIVTLWRLALVSQAANRQAEAKTKKSARRPSAETQPAKRGRSR